VPPPRPRNISANRRNVTWHMRTELPTFNAVFPRSHSAGLTAGRCRLSNGATPRAAPGAPGIYGKRVATVSTGSHADRFNDNDEDGRARANRIAEPYFGMSSRVLFGIILTPPSYLCDGQDHDAGGGPSKPRQSITASTRTLILALPDTQG
jgi:hypothetical protein